MNTKWTVEYISATALKETCDRLGIEVEERPTCLDLKFSRMEMDENGFHEGYGTWTVRLKLYKREYVCSLHTGLPLGLEPFAVCLDGASLHHICFPKKNATYYPPDKEFIWQEWDCSKNYIMKHLEEAKFSNEDGRRIWTIGSHEWEVK